MRGAAPPFLRRVDARRLVRRAPVVALVALVLAARPLLGQDETARLRNQRAELERIRNERTELEREAEALHSRAHDLSEEVDNLDRRAEATARLVGALEAQLAVINKDFDDASVNVARAEAQLGVKRSVLRRRLIDIYKRGPLYTFQALLSAKSFGELVARYKYLHLLTLRDRALVTTVERLRNRVARERDHLATLRSAIEENRAERASEEERLRSLERTRAASLEDVQHDARVADEKIDNLRRTETQLANAIAAFDAERRRVESDRPITTRRVSGIRASDYGNLEWPVEGPLVYTFGKAQTASNATIRWNGIGIRANAGTPVRAVAAGKVVSVRQMGTYGLTIIIDHGGGDYSIYGSLSKADVREQQSVTKGQPIGSVGISDPELPPHLHFEIRQNGGPAVDPAEWLRSIR
jgi:murein hydrolase activator